MVSVCSYKPYSEKKQREKTIITLKKNMRKKIDKKKYKKINK